MAVVDSSRPQSLARGLGRRVGVPGFGILAAGFVAAAALLPVAQSSNATTTGHEIRQLEARRADLQASIYTTQAEIAALGSLERVDREARERLGMIPAERIMYVPASRPPPVAAAPARFLHQQEEPPPAHSSRPWWRAALSKFSLP
jgi:hypothetical protein